TGIEYKKWLNYRQEDADGNIIPNNVYIFGHSLDVTDKDVLNEIITSPNIAATTIFYRHKQQQAEQIANLSKILGQDTLLKYVNSTTPKIIFKQQRDMIEIPESKE
ncbi:MAG: hypothetical protein IJL71_04215, partial [Oscillospiraceae bacterium]|nr:hypothetical protein [Oscillospiraceae bacterium]